MKTRLEQFLIAAFFAATFLGLHGCKKVDLSEATSNINTAIYVSPISIRFVDVDTATKVIPDTKVTIGGDAAQYVVASDGGNLSTSSSAFQTSHGFLNLALATTTGLPTTSHPVNFTISASPAGYMPVIRTLSITDTTPTILTISVVKSTALGNFGASVTPTIQNTLSGDTLSADAQLLTVPMGKMTEKATITIPSGTKFLDANGNQIHASSINTNIVQYGTGVPGVQDIFPGGLNPKNVIGADGNAINGGVQFITAGLLNINMNAGNTAVKKFSKPLDVNVELNSNLQNPESGKALQAGDYIPVWSMDEGTGQWKYESKAVVAPDPSSGKLTANFKASHLSNWNLDWSWDYFGSHGTTFKPLTCVLNIANGFYGYPWEVILVDQNYNYLAGDHYEYVYNGYTTTLPYIPNVPQARFILKPSPWYTGNYPALDYVAQTPLFNPKTQNSITLTYAPPPPPERANLVYNVTGKCSNKNTAINVGAWVYYWSDDWSEFYYSYISTYGWSYNNNISLQVNKKYNIGIWYGGTWNQSSFTMTKSDFTLPTVLIPGTGLISGYGKYNAGSKTLTVTSSFQVVCK
ncbi:hypothetical protein [Parasediminibacterium sp. JCM 36343]|uniref:hypothetical protein n=1 Tax=Parasediminibacterium sp. JCM 36343 TaxID=3374279 RepID=UPI00397E6BFF